MKCSNCGKEIERGVRFCRFCGSEIVKNDISLDLKSYQIKPLKYLLVERCNPANFLNPYDKEKVEKSNILFNKLQNGSVGEEELLNIAEEAIDALGVAIYDQKDVAKLKDLSNPRNFVNPYNAEKVHIANEIFSQLMERDDFSVREFCSLKRGGDSLYAITKVVVDEESKPKEDNFAQKQEEKSENDSDFGTFLFLFGLIILVIVFIIASMSH